MKKERSKRRRLLKIAGGVLAEALLMRLRNYPMGTDVVVRCRKGHLFSTIWLPGISVKALRLVWWRVQRCPVGGHWSIVTPVRHGEVSADERRIAHERKDLRLP